jgi:hypothetical protein
MKHLLVVANAARACVLEDGAKLGAYAHVEDLVHPGSRQKGTELGTAPARPLPPRRRPPHFELSRRKRRGADGATIAACRRRSSSGSWIRLPRRGTLRLH